MKVKKLFWMLLGLIGLGLGAVGAVIPMFPSFIFLLLAAVSFAKSSERLHSWFIQTKLYQQNLESYMEGRGMTRASKIRLMGTITLVMGISCVIMLSKELYIPCIILGVIWVFHIGYFILGIKTLQAEAGKS